MRTALIGLALLVLGAVAVGSGVLPGAEALALAERVWPILLFVVAITVVAELAAEAGVFRYLAERAAEWGRGRTIVLWLLVVAFATASTVFLSLDTTAVLLTPVVVVLARHVGVSPLPFALTTVWLANTASLLLPVSNLTNLLAEHALGSAGPGAFVALTWLPALVAVLVPSALLLLVYRRQLFGRYAQEHPQPVEDRVLFGCSAAVLVLLIPALVSGLPVWLPASVAAVVLVVVFLARRPRLLSPALVPWSLVLLASGLFLAMESAHALGLGDLLAGFVGGGDDAAALLRMSAVAALGANAVDNLPAYLALEPAAGSPDRVIALLIGVNAGPLITPWASLATLLWHQRLTRMDVQISWGRYAMLGLIAAPLTVVAATLALAVRPG
ncbi:SLC13 family permease [Microbacteriaceae bacterium 4G12]